MNEQDPASAPTQGNPSGAAPGYPGAPVPPGTPGYPGAPGGDPRAAWAPPGSQAAPAGSQWGGPTAGGAPAPGSAGHPIPLQPAPVLFKPEPKRRGGPSAFAVVFTLAALLCVGGVAFAAGRLTAPAATSATNPNTNPFGNGRFPNASFAPGSSFAPGAFGNGRGGLNGGLSIEGKVTSVAADGTITLSLTNGGTLDVATNGKTTYHNETAGTAASVTTGATVRVQLSSAAFGNGFGGGQAPGASLAPDASVAPVTTTATDILVVTP